MSERNIRLMFRVIANDLSKAVKYIFNNFTNLNNKSINISFVIYEIR
jgi:hypothetical protein